MTKIIALITLLCLMTFVNAGEIYPFEDTGQEILFDKLTKEYRCLTCQNQNLSESSAPVAMTIKNEIYTMILEGQSEGQIEQQMHARYGDYLFYEPPVSSKTALLWLLPFIFLLIVIMIFIRNFKMNNAQ